MGRKHYSQRVPQHSRHAKRRDSWSGESAPRIFGARRSLESNSAFRLIHGVRELQLAGEIPEELTFKPRAHVEVVPGRILSEQVQKGIVTLSEKRMLRLGNTLMSNGASLELADADIKGVSMRSGCNLRITLASTALEAEREAMADVLEDYGFQGIHRHRKETALHITLASGRRDGLAYQERQHTEAIVGDLIDQVHHFEEPFEFGRIALMPPPEALAA